jgi:hypothetical protein
MKDHRDSVGTHRIESFLRGSRGQDSPGLDAGCITVLRSDDCEDQGLLRVNEHTEINGYQGIQVGKCHTMDELIPL